jgi:transposase
MVGRLSTYAKNRILNLRFQNNYKIKHIAQTLLQEDNIKVSRESISTFLKKYIDTKSINDKPRSGRNKKLTSEEIQLIGEVTRLNRDITAPKIKQYLNLNVSTHTILRASKLFEWNKNNPNSNEAKKAAALERQLNGETKRRSKSYRRKIASANNLNNQDGSKDNQNESESSFDCK